MTNAKPRGIDVYDTVIKGGSIIDGTGAARFGADIGIVEGRIATIGQIDTDAATTIDATGKVVSPGFVDVHTHYDAQAFWDTTLSPSPLHGVTTVIGGNCGFTIAPLSEDPSVGDYLMRMLARVEGMPLESLQTGVPWSWRTYGEFLDTIDGTLSINAGFKVGHSAIRRVVMGAEANEREATPEELAAMKELLRDGLDAGGIGFSSTWSRTHNDADGVMVPSRWASRDEIVELAGVCSEFEGTSLEFLPCVGPFEQWALDLMADMSAAAQRPLNWNVMNVVAKNRDEQFEKLHAGTFAAERGGKVIALMVPMNLGLRMSLRSGFVLDALPGWDELMGMGHEQKVAELSDPAKRGKWNDLAQGDGPLRNLAHWAGQTIFNTVDPANKAFEGRTVAEAADELGLDTWDALCEIAVADDLNTSFGKIPPDETGEDWAARVEILRDGRAVIGASDAGAHLDLFGTFNYATYVLGNAVREHSALPLEEAVHLMTQVQADLYGLRDRGTLAVGNHADIVIFDESTIDTNDMTFKFDLPGGAGRLFADASGIEHVFCNGAEIVRNGELNDARPGTLLRSGRDTRNPALT